MPSMDDVKKMAGKLGYPVISSYVCVSLRLADCGPAFQVPRSYILDYVGGGEMQKCIWYYV